eukprot:m.157022 g.157022  ORF g.157022 m.157022 type:complete len:648 (+) comp38696_c0_seq5:169-2112(+)
MESLALLFLSTVTVAFSENAFKCGSPVLIGDEPGMVYLLNNSLTIFSADKKTEHLFFWQIKREGEFLRVPQDVSPEFHIEIDDTLTLTTWVPQTNGTSVRYHLIPLVERDVVFTSAFVTLLLGESPETFPSYVNMSVFHNDSSKTQLNYTWTGTPEPQKRLIRIDKQLQNATAEKFQLNEYNLTFSNLLFPEEAGLYGINVSNCLKFTILKVRIDVIATPPGIQIFLYEAAHSHYDETQEVLFAKLGRTWTVPFKVSGFPLPAFSWTNENKILPKNPYEKNNLSFSVFEPGIHRFTLNSSNVAGSAKTSFILQTYDFKLEEAVHCSVGKNTELSCTASAYPAVFVIWQKNGVTIARNDLTSTSPFNFVSETLVQKISRKSFTSDDSFSCQYGVITATGVLLEIKTFTISANIEGCKLKLNETRVSQETMGKAARFTVPCIFPESEEPSFVYALENSEGNILDERQCEDRASSVTLATPRLSPGNYSFFITINNTARGQRLEKHVSIPETTVNGLELYEWVIISASFGGFVFILLWILIPLNPRVRHWLQKNTCSCCYNCYNGVLEEKKLLEEVDGQERTWPALLPPLPRYEGIFPDPWARGLPTKFIRLWAKQPMTEKRAEKKVELEPEKDVIPEATAEATASVVNS